MVRKSQAGFAPAGPARSAGEPPEPVGASLREAGQRWRASPSALSAAPARLAQVHELDVDVLKRDAVARHRSDADQRVAEWIHCEAEQRQQIADFVALEQAAEMKNRDAACLQRGGDLVQPPVRATKHRLIAQPHALLSNSRMLAATPSASSSSRVKTSQFRGRRARARDRPSAASGSMPDDAPISLRECDERCRRSAGSNDS